MDPQQLFARLRGAAASLTPRQLVTLVVSFVAVVGVVIGSAYWLNKPDYRALMANMDPADADTLVASLRADKVDFVLEDGGRTVLVPATDIDTLRLKLAGDGIPKSGYLGWEIFDEVRFGITDFGEKVNYQRALEGELSRTLAKIREVAGAKVHLAFPKETVFVDRAEAAQPTASVVLQLRQNSRLSSATVHAVTALVAGSVPSLLPDNVTVIDDQGRPLATPSEDPDGNTGPAMERQLTIEKELQKKALDIVEPLVGAGRVRVNVSARLTTASAEVNEQKLDPMSVAVMKEQVASQSAGGVLVGGTVAASGAGAGGAGGVTGAQGNVPAAGQGGAVAPPPAATTMRPGQSNSQSQSREWDVSRTTTRTVQPQGRVERLTVAVLVDDLYTAPEPGSTTPGTSTPRTPELLERIRKLVESSVGFDSMRGDVITVENVAFDRPPVEPVVEVPIWQRYQDQGFEALRILAVLIIAILAFVMVLKPMVRGSMPAQLPAAAAGGGNFVQAKTVQDMEQELENELNAAANAVSKRLPALTKRAGTFSQKEPENAARLLRAWLTEEER